MSTHRPMEGIRILDLAKRVLEATGSSSELEFIPYDRVYGQGIEDMFHRIPSIDKVAAAIGWGPERTLTEILADVIEYAYATTPERSVVP